MSRVRQHPSCEPIPSNRSVAWAKAPPPQKPCQTTFNTLIFTNGLITLLQCWIVAPDCMERTPMSKSKVLLIGSMVLLAAKSGAAQTPPFNQCPPIGANTSCRILLVIDKTGSLRVLTDTSQSPTYDGNDDTLIGVLNQSDNSIAAIPLQSTQGIFSFDGDGICTFPGGPPCGPTGYEGPGVTFSNINAAQTAGVVNFGPALTAGGGTAYFGLELAIQTQCPTLTPPNALNQGNPKWANISLGHSKNTIGSYGCFITSASMLINYHAAKIGSSFRTDPAQLNAYLTAQGAYDTNGAVQPDSVAQIATYATQNGIPLYYGGLKAPRDDFTLDQYLCNLQPPMLYVGKPHWVFATGQTVVNSNQTYSDIDPDSWPNGNTLQGFGYTYGGMQLFTDTQQPLSGLYVIAHSPVELLITSPSGNQTGYNAATGKTFANIPQSGYVAQSLANDTTHRGPYTPTTKVFDVIGPDNGTYSVQAIGTGTGPFSLDFASYDSGGNHTRTTLTGSTIPGVINKYSITYSDQIGSKLQIMASNPADINGDGIVNCDDIAIVKAALGTTRGMPGFDPRADVNHDNIVNNIDLSFVASHTPYTQCP